MDAEVEKKQIELFKKFQNEIKDCEKSAIRFDSKLKLAVLTFFQNSKVKLKFCFQSFESAERFKQRLICC